MSKKKNVKAEMRTITPEDAAAMIKATGSRNFRKPTLLRINTLAKQMLAGEWIVNGETVKLNGKIVIDGLHRLHACVKANKAFTTLVVEGLPASSSETIDIGRPRTLAQHFSYAGVLNYKAAASITNQWLTLQRGRWNQGRETDYNVTIHDCLRFYEQHRESIDDVVSMVLKKHDGVAASKVIPAGILGPVLCEGAAGLDCLASESTYGPLFCEVIAMGTGQSNSPPLKLREKFLADKAKQMRMTVLYQRALVIYCWNLWVAGETLQKLGLRLSGPNSIEFPSVSREE